MLSVNVTAVTVDPAGILARLNRINVRRTVLSVAGITERGYFNSNLLLVETERVMIEAADEVIVVADSTKFGRQSLALLSELGGISTLVADDGMSKDWRSRVEQAGVKLKVATVSSQ